MRSKRQAAVQVGRQAGHHSPLLLYYTRSPHLLLDADHPGILVGRHRLSLPSSPPALSPSHISWWVDSCWSGSPTLLLSVGQPHKRRRSTNFVIFPVVLDSSDGRSSEPLIDGSEFLEATSKKVSNNTYADHITEYSSYMGHKVAPNFGFSKMGFRPWREGEGEGAYQIIVIFFTLTQFLELKFYT